MSDDIYIAAVAVGPVGAFIAGGRRSRDLWFGSRFLSEATRWAAHTLWLAGEVELILPTLERIREPFLHGRRDQGPTISNKILCRVAASEDRVRALLAAARTQAHLFLAEEIRGHREQLKEIITAAQLDRQAEAIEQGDFVEFHAAWARLAARTDAAEEEAIRRAFDLLDGRKAARLFVAPASEAGRPKCSLEPGWDSVLTDSDLDRPQDAARLFLGRQRVGIRPDERLSAVGLARRMAALDYTMDDRPIELQRLPFPPLAQVAADAWLVAARRDHRHHVERIEAAFRRLFDRASGLGREAAFVLASPARPPGSRGDVATVFDASIYFEGAIEARRREILRFGERYQVKRGDLLPHLALLDEIEGPVRALQEEMGLPSPYYALLEADGDGVGEAIKRAQGAARVRLVQALYDFADEAWRKIEEYGGCAFYVGADEMAAYLPLDRAAPAARALAALYEERVAPLAPTSTPTSLSVGIAIAHVHEDLRAVRKHASDALKKAKERRREAGAQAQPGYLMIYEEPRGGDRRDTAGPVAALADRLDRCERLLAAGRVSVSTAHAMLSLHEELERPEGALGLALGKAILPLKRRRAGAAAAAASAGDSPLAQDEDALKDEIRAAATWKELRDLASCLLLASRIAPVARLRRQGGAS